MLPINLENSPELYTDYKIGLKYLKNLKDEDYEYPEEITYFHVYTEVKDSKELLAIKSYLATQNLEKTRLIVWSDYDISYNEDIQPYTDLVEFRVYDPLEESKGTPLEGETFHLNWGHDEDPFHWMRSGVFRFLVLYKYGGIYMDVDMVLLRDFKPILGQDFAYQWGVSTDFGKKDRGEDCFGPCAAMVGATKGGLFIETCMEQLIKTSPKYNTTCYDEEMLAHVYNTLGGFTVFPSSFFNTEWQTSNAEDKKVIAGVEATWFRAPLQNLDHLFLDAFSWHWHHGRYKEEGVVAGSKMSLLNDITDKKLYYKSIADIRYTGTNRYSNTVKIEKVTPSAQIPAKGTPHAAAYDLYAIESVTIPVGETVVVGTGVALKIPQGFKGEIYSRSGLASKGLVVANSPGKIDCDYRGEIKVILHNTRNSDTIEIEVGDRIAQFEINPVYPIEFEEVAHRPIGTKDPDFSTRGDKGFGSTGD